MWVRKFLCVFLLVFSCLTLAHCQQATLHSEFEVSGGYITSGVIPFWFRSLTSGNLPGDGLTAGLIGSLLREYEKDRKLRWGAGIKMRLNADSYTDPKLIEGYVKVKALAFELKAGRSRDIMGLCDTSLTSGSFSISGNAPGIPSVQVSIPEFLRFHFLGDLISIKANYSHGWLGNTSTNMDGRISIQKTFLHQKSLYLKIGKAGGRFNFYGGFNHQVLWGNEKAIFGNAFSLTPIETYLYVITGKDYSTSTIEPSRIGNHLGSVDAGAEYLFNNLKLFIYRQSFYDYVSLKYLANISDGLNGLSLSNMNSANRLLGFKKVLIEFLYSKDQGRKQLYNENYYNNYIYEDGWSYRNLSLGNPLLTSKIYLRKGLSGEVLDYFHNNRVVAVHGAIAGNLLGWQVSVRATYSWNFGTYFSPFASKSVNQFSGYMDMSNSFGLINLGLRAAFDKGGLLYDSKGLIFFVNGRF